MCSFSVGAAYKISCIASVRTFWLGCGICNMVTKVLTLAHPQALSIRYGGTYANLAYKHFLPMLLPRCHAIVAYVPTQLLLRCTSTTDASKPCLHSRACCSRASFASVVDPPSTKQPLLLSRQGTTLVSVPIHTTRRQGTMFVSCFG